MSMYSFLAIPIGYLLGSIPSGYIIGRFGNIDLRTEGDGRISAAAIKKRMGVKPFLLVVVMDVCKGMLSTIIAKILVSSPTVDDLPLVPLLIVLASGFVAVVGHIWSPFIKFQGGLGATVLYGVLAGILLWPQELIALLIGAMTVLITRKSGFSTGVIIGTLFVILIIQKLLWSPDLSPILIAYPLILILLMIVKRLQIKKTRGIESLGLAEYWKKP